MEFSLNLEKMFPTEESRFDAYKKWIIIASIGSPVIGFLSRVVASFAKRGVIPEWGGIILLLGAIASLFGLYVLFYILWKSKTISAVLRMIFGMLIGVVLSLMTGGIYALVSLWFNRKRLFQYIQTEGRFIKDQCILCIILPFCCLMMVVIGSLVTFRSPIPIIVLDFVFPFIVLIFCLQRLNKEYKAEESFVNKRNIFLLIAFWLCVLTLVRDLLSALTNPFALMVLMTSDSFVMFGILAYLVYVVFVPAYSIHIFNREKANGTTFYNTVLRISMAGFFLFFCILALTAAIHSHIFSGDEVLHDITNSYDPTLPGADTVVTPTPDITTTHIADIPTGDSGMAMAVDPSIGSVDTNPIDLLHNPDISHADFSAADMNLVDSTIPHYSAFDVFPDSLANVFDGTNMVDIPQIQQHPYLIFNDPSVQGNFQVCDASGMPQMTISNGNIVNSEYVVVGHVNTDAVSGVTTYTDINNVPLYSVDSHGQMFSDGCYIGHTTHSGNIIEIRDINEKLLAMQDKLTGTFRSPDGKILSQVKQM